MYPIRMERDTPAYDWKTLVPWTDADDDPVPVLALVRSDGTKAEKYTTLNVHAVTGIIAARKMRSVGVHIEGPETGTPFTCYAISCKVFGIDDNIRPVLMMGESPAVIDTTAAGNSVISAQPIAVGGNVGLEGFALEKETIICVNENTAERGLCFFINLIAGAAPSADSLAVVSMSVRRLVGSSLQVLNPYTA